MGFEYLSSFNGGELSEYMDSRTDIDKYRSGCAKLENMYVLPQGGVERRIGSKYIADTISSDVRLIPFDFSEDYSYVIEFGIDKLRVYDGDGYTGVELNHDFTPQEFKTLKYKRILDIMYLVSPTHRVMRFSRTSLDPLTFTLEALEFIYPPFLEENQDFNSLVELQPLEWEANSEYYPLEQVQYNGNYYSCLIENLSAGNPVATPANWQLISHNQLDTSTGLVVKLIATANIFNENMVGAEWRMRHERTENNIADTGQLIYTNQSSKEIFIGTDNYSISITNQRRVVARATYISKSRIDVFNGSAWSTLATYNDSGTFTYTNVGGGAGHKVRVVKTNDLGASTTYSIGLKSNRRISGVTSGAIFTSAPLDVSFSNWSVKTGGDWNGVMQLEKSVDNKFTWTEEVTIGDTYEVNASNFIINSPAKEAGTTFIRIKFVAQGASTAKYNILNTSLYAEGLATILEYIDANTVKVLITNLFGSASPTKYWTEGAFSNYRGYPIAIELYEDRIVYSGTANDPSTIWMSTVGDFQNFQLGPNDDEAIKSIPSTPEITQWLLTKETLHQGTIGGLINTYSVDGDSVITPSTIKSSKESAYGTHNVQALFANDVSVYVQRLGKKLRELIYNYDQNKFDSNDLTILASHITGGGVTEMVLQATPDQIIWCLTTEGTLAGLTYERNEAVIGWHSHDFGGTIKSIAIRPASGEDELWIAIERKNGTFLEKCESRIFSDDLLDAWFVDSGVKTIKHPNQDFDACTVEEVAPFKAIITKTDHNLSDGAIIRLNTSTEPLNVIPFSIEYIDDDNFTLRDADDIGYINMSDVDVPDTITVSNIIDTTPSTNVNGVYTRLPTKINDRYAYQYGFIYDPVESAGAYFTILFDGFEWKLQRETNRPFSSGYMYKNTSATGKVPLTDWMQDTLYVGPNLPVIEYEGWYGNITGSITEVSNTWTGLDHLEGEHVQVQADGGYEGIHEVVDGTIITSDYYNQAVIGLPYISLLQPMFIEPAGLPNGFKKKTCSVLLKFIRTIGAITGIKTNKRLGSSIKANSQAFHPVAVPSYIDEAEYNSNEAGFRITTDVLSHPINPYSGDQLVYINDGWDRLKGIYVVQNIPMPMTITGMSVVIKTGDER